MNDASTPHVLEPSMRELMQEAGVEDINIRSDEKGLLGTGKFRGTETQLRNRLGTELDIKVLETADQPTVVRCRPRE
jgi:hypothetical protein